MNVLNGLKDSVYGRLSCDYLCAAISFIRYFAGEALHTFGMCSFIHSHVMQRFSLAFVVFCVRKTDICEYLHAGLLY